MKEEVYSCKSWFNKWCCDCKNENFSYVTITNQFTQCFCNNSSTFPTYVSNLLKVLEPNLMKLDFSELTLTSLN
jgi:hypothetical protein